MMAVWPSLDSKIECGLLVVTGVVQPSAITRPYRVRLTYREFGYPKVYVLSPKLVRRAQEPTKPIPHTYDDSTAGQERPCVYCPYGREWTPVRPLATSIMPWLLSWLVDYEIWLATGEWLGGGVSHRSTKTPDGDRGQQEL